MMYLNKVLAVCVYKASKVAQVFLLAASHLFLVSGCNGILSCLEKLTSSPTQTMGTNTLNKMFVLKQPTTACELP